MQTSNSETIFTVAHFGQTAIAFLQSDVLAIEPIKDLQPAADRDKSVGKIDYASQQISVYSINSDLQHVPGVNDKARYCLCLRNPSGERHIAVIVDSIEQFEINEKTLSTPVSDLMPATQKLIKRLFIYQGSLLMECNSAAFFQYLIQGHI